MADKNYGLETKNLLPAASWSARNGGGWSRTGSSGEETMVAFALWRQGSAALAASVALLIAAVASIPAAGQERFPQRPIKLFVPFTAGGAYDFAARLIADAMGKDLDGSIVVENRPGGGGNIGAQAVAGAEADGYTLLFGGLPMITAALTSPDLGYDMFKDLTPVCGAMALESVLVTSKSTRIASIAALKDKIASGAWVTYGTQGIYTPGHFMGAWFARVAGGKAEAVHYKGGSAYMTDLLSGTLTYVAATLPVYFGLSDRLQVLATLSQQPLTRIPDAPTMTQAGMPEYMAVDWRLWAAIYAPAKIPAAVRDRLYAACDAAVSTEKTKESFAVYAMEPMTDYTPERLSAFQEEQFRKWKVLVDKLALRK
jgi:tripartite-type tricarboxylate transporter receptor subunit TctC